MQLFSWYKVLVKPVTFCASYLLLSQFRFAFHFLLCEVGSGSFKYFFVSWHNVKHCQWRLLQGYSKKVFFPVSNHSVWLASATPTFLTIQLLLCVWFLQHPVLSVHGTLQYLKTDSFPQDYLLSRQFCSGVPLAFSRYYVDI